MTSEEYLIKEISKLELAKKRVDRYSLSDYKTWNGPIMIAKVKLPEQRLYSEYWNFAAIYYNPINDKFSIKISSRDIEDWFRKPVPDWEDRGKPIEEFSDHVFENFMSYLDGSNLNNELSERVAEWIRPDNFISYLMPHG